MPAQGTSWDTEDFDCGNNYGGCYDVNDCDSLPDDTNFPPGSGPDLRDGCKWRFGDSYKQHDNPQSEPDPTNNPYVRFRRVKCPSALTNITWSIPLDDDDYPAVDLDSYASDYTHPPTMLPTLTPAPSPASANTTAPTPRPVPKPTPAPTPWDGPSELCEVCPNGQDVTFPVAAEVTNFTQENIPDVRSASYVTLYASFDFSDWFQVSHSGVFTGLRDALNQTVDVCTDPPPELDDFIMGASAGSKITSYQQAVEATTDTSATTTKGTQTEMVSDIQPILDDEFQAFLDYERDIVDCHLSTCCIGMPTYTYLVACLTPEYPHDITENFWYYQPQRGPPFTDRRRRAAVTLDVLRSPFFALSFAVYAATVAAFAHPAGIEDRTLYMTTLTALGAFLSFASIFLNKETYQRFRVSYEASTASQSAIFECATVSRLGLRDVAGRTVVRFLCAAYLAAFAGLRDSHYDVEQVLLPFVQRHGLLTEREWALLSRRGGFAATVVWRVS